MKIGSSHPLLSWADLDNDGRRDLLASESERLLPTRVDSTLLKNVSKDGHWIEVEAADALGAEVRVRAGGRTFIGWVGESEGSRWSDAHRRVYFGVGRARQAKVTLTTQTGRSTIRTATNRLVTFP